MNILMISGRLAADPELRYTVSGTAVTNLRIADNWQGKDKEPQVQFLPIALFGLAAENVVKYKKKGDWVEIEGRVIIRSVERDEKKTYYTNLVGTRINYGPNAFRKEEPVPPAPMDGVIAGEDIAFDDETLPF